MEKVKGSSKSPGIFVEPRTVEIPSKGRRRVKSHPRHRRKICESYGRKVSQKVSYGQKTYQTRVTLFEKDRFI